MATNAAMLAAMSGTPHSFVAGARVGRLLEGGVDDSPLSGLMVAGERGELAAAGDKGAVLFTNARVIIAEEAGVMSKRLAVKAIRRDTISSYVIDPADTVALTLQGGSFGTVNIVFDAGFDPMQLSTWLGETLVGPQIGAHA